MAFNLLYRPVSQLSSILKGVAVSPSFAQVRGAKKKAGRAVRGTGKKPRGKACAPKRLEGCYVNRGEVLATQRLLRYYPGENVELGRDNTLYAMCDGKVLVTAETLSPYPDSPLYEAVRKGLVIKKKFFHVNPIPLHGKFRLVSQI